jgi:hypothetical protein
MIDAQQRILRESAARSMRSSASYGRAHGKIDAQQRILRECAAAHATRRAHCKDVRNSTRYLLLFTVFSLRYKFQRL